MFKATLDSSLEVAVKFLDPNELEFTEASRVNFKAEIQIMQLCKDPHVVACLGAWVDKVMPAHAHDFPVRPRNSAHQLY